MRILGIDYGRKKIGLALATSSIASPYGVIKIENENTALVKIKNVVYKEKVEKIVIGISEGEMAEESKDFGEKLRDNLGIAVDYQDETLTTKEAQDLSRSAQIKRKKRRELEDAYAANITLQAYLDAE